jgi:hypothetical protein
MQMSYDWEEKWNGEELGKQPGRKWMADEGNVE